MLRISSLLPFLGLSMLALAAPVHEEKRAVIPVSASTVSGFTPYTQLARAAYCPGIATWKCGGECRPFS